MSRQQNLEATVRRTFEAVNNRDTTAIQTNTDPEAELTSRFAAIDGKTYRGHAGVSDYIADMTATWEDFRLEIEEFIPVGDEKLVVIARVKGMARGSDFPLDERTFGAYEFRNEKAFRVEWFPSRAEALTAAGLSND